MARPSVTAWARMRFALFVVLSMLPGCATTFESLSRPALFLTGPVGELCDGTTAVDADGSVWWEHGCEGTTSGVNRERRLTRAQQMRIRAALAALRKVPGSEMSTERCEDGWQRFTLAEANGSRREWYVCPRGMPPVYPPPFAAVMEALR